MGSLSDYAEGKLLDHLFNTAYSPVATVYLALCTADPTDAATGAACNEVPNAGNYARTAIAFGAAGSRQITQNAVTTFPTANAGWGTASHWAIVDIGTYGAGNVLAHGAFAVPKSIVSGNTPSVASTEVYVNFSTGGIGTVVAGKLLDLMFRNTAYAKPDTYVAMIITNPVVDGDTGTTITEPSGGSYARKQVNINGGASPTWDLASGTTPTFVDNTHDITFTTATGSWGTVIAWAICSASTLGDVIAYDNSMADQAVDSGDTAKFLAGNLDIQMT
jgi:hypothetical protein